jgi:MFS family permease
MIHSAIYHIGLMGIPDVLLNFYFVSLGYSPDVIALLQSLPRIGGLLTGLPIGFYAERIGNRRIIVIGTLGVAAASLALALFPSLILLVISRFLIGAFYGAAQIVQAPFMTNLAEQDQQIRLYAYHNIISMGSAALGSFIGGYLPALLVRVFPTLVGGIVTAPEQSSIAYGTALALSAMLTFLSVVPLLGIRDQELPVLPKPESVRIPVREFPWFRLLLFGFPLLIFGFSGGLTFPFYNLFFRTTFTLDDATVGSILSLGWLGMALVPMLNPQWERLFGRVRALSLMLTIAAIAFLILSLAPTLTLAILAYAVAISTRNTMQPLFQPLVMDLLPEQQRALASSIGYVQWNVGWFVATSVSGGWQIHYGFGFIMQVVAGAVLLTALVVLWIFYWQGRSAPLNRRVT